MICPKALVGMQMLSADQASEGRLTPVIPPRAALNTIAPHFHVFWPMANKATLCNSRDCGLHRGTRRGVESGYLLQELLAEVQYLSLSAVLEVHSLWALIMHISSSHHANAGQVRRPLLWTTW